MAKDRMNKAARGGLMGRLRGNMDQKRQGSAVDAEKSQAMVNQAVKGGGEPAAPPQQRPARRGPANYTPDETQAMVERAMSGAGNIAQGTREAWAAQSPADPDPENEADLPNFADNSQAASQRRRLGMRSRLARR